MGKKEVVRCSRNNKMERQRANRSEKKKTKWVKEDEREKKKIDAQAQKANCMQEKTR